MENRFEKEISGRYWEINHISTSVIDLNLNLLVTIFSASTHTH